MQYQLPRSTSPSTTPALRPSPQLSALPLPSQLPLPSIPEPASTSLRRNASSSSHRSSAFAPSPRQSSAHLPSQASSASGSRSGSLISTPRLLSRRNSAKEQHRPTGLFRKVSGRSQQDDDLTRSPLSESGSGEVVETLHARLERDPESGRKMINQYIVKHEIGHGTHGRVRLGEEVTVELNGEAGPSIRQLYAIKIVDRVPKRKRLTGFNRNKASQGKLVNESEIRKEIAIFKKVNHPNVVKMKEIIDDPENSKLFMILEYCEKGEIKWKSGEGGPALTLSETRRIFRETLLGLEYLHHQGIIHRDIKPSNLLLSSDGTVKISDFGCSHYSEALRAAAAQGDGEDYVDDIELAKTAGSPAFFAPEMCFSGLDNDADRRSDLPSISLRPPSLDHTETRASRSDPLVNAPTTRAEPLKPTFSNDSALSRPGSARSGSASTLPRRDRLPITNAIDVWALGVTLYCLLFGQTPFDAPNEYLLMQVIPTADYDVPTTMASDALPVTAPEARECLDLLRRLLEKDPAKRIPLEQAKKHPFTLRGLLDANNWLASTDPHTQSYVTVSNDEVAVVVKSRTFARLKEKVHHLTTKILSRSRSRSITDNNHLDDPSKRPPPSPRPAGLARRMSLLNGARQSSPARPSPVYVPVNDDGDRPLASSGSLDKIKHSPPSYLRRRQSSDIDVLGRQRSPSAASSSNIGKIVRLLSRNGSQRSTAQPRSPVLVDEATFRRMSLDDPIPRQSLETFESSSSREPDALWESRLEHETSRQDSNLSEEVDWNETLSDDDEYDQPTSTLPPSAPDLKHTWDIDGADGHDYVRSGSPYRLTHERARSPLRRVSDDAVDDDGDALAISVGSRRGRKGSMLAER